MKKEKTGKGSVIPAVILTIAMCALIIAGIALTSSIVKARFAETTEITEGGDR
jgi:hypothetical protein